MKKKEVIENNTTRRKEQQPLLYWGTIVTLVIVVLAFVVAPIFTGRYTAPVKSAIGSFEGKPISGDYYSLYQSNMQILRMNLSNMVAQGQISPEMESAYFNFYRQESLRTTVEMHAISHLLKKAGIETSNNRIESMLREQCGDYGLGVLYRIDSSKAPSKANFSEKKYQEASLRNPSQVKGVKNVLMLRNNFALFGTDLSHLATFSQKETDFLNQMAKQTASADYFEITDSMISEEQLTPWIEKNLDDFTNLSLQVVRTGDKKKAKEIALEVSEDPEIFAERAKVFNAPLTDSEGKISGYAYEIFSKLNIKKKATKALIEKLVEGELSSIISADGYFYLFKALKEAEKAESFLLVKTDREKILSIIKEKEKAHYETLLNEKAESIANEAKEGDFNKIASTYQAEILKLENIPLNYNNCEFLPSIAPTDFADDKVLFTELFSQKEGSTFGPVSNQNKIYLFHLVNRFEKADNAATINENSILETMYKGYIFSPKRYTAVPFASEAIDS